MGQRPSQKRENNQKTHFLTSAARCLSARLKRCFNHGFCASLKKRHGEYTHMLSQNLISAISQQQNNTFLLETAGNASHASNFLCSAERNHAAKHTREYKVLCVQCIDWRRVGFDWCGVRARDDSPSFKLITRSRRAII